MGRRSVWTEERGTSDEGRRCTRGVQEASGRHRKIDSMSDFIGRAIVRREDPALLTGHGVYLDDVTPPGTLHAFVVRSPVAHARIAGVDVTDARNAPGVAAVFIAADLAGIGPLPGAEGLPPGSVNPAYPLLAADKVLWAGQPVALVVADTPEHAADGAELVVADYSELPAVTS